MEEKIPRHWMARWRDTGRLKIGTDKTKKGRKRFWNCERFFEKVFWQANHNIRLFLPGVRIFWVQVKTRIFNLWFSFDVGHTTFCIFPSFQNYCIGVLSILNNRLKNISDSDRCSDCRNILLQLKFKFNHFEKMTYKGYLHWNCKVLQVDLHDKFRLLKF